mmetsp:Transcript_117724/g.214086  ORF Transcript_117724/g.214086 Transcript_117724/m.214086 type:complete len:97 (-) Transcript_117724:430-720(-)
MRSAPPSCSASMPESMQAPWRQEKPSLKRRSPSPEEEEEERRRRFQDLMDQMDAFELGSLKTQELRDLLQMVEELKTEIREESFKRFRRGPPKKKQ